MGIPSTLLENMIANLNVHIVQEKVEHFRYFPGCSKEHASSFGIGPVGVEISIYTNILLVEALETFTNKLGNALFQLIQCVASLYKGC